MAGQDVRDDDRDPAPEHVAVGHVPAHRLEAHAQEVVEVDAAAPDDHHALALQLLHRRRVVGHHVAQLAQDRGQHLRQLQRRGQRLRRGAQRLRLLARGPLGREEPVVAVRDGRHLGDVAAQPLIGEIVLFRD